MRGGGAPASREVKREVVLPTASVLDLRFEAVRSGGARQRAEPREYFCLDAAAKLSHRLHRVRQRKNASREGPGFGRDLRLSVVVAGENQQQLLERHAVLVVVLVEHHVEYLAPVLILDVNARDLPEVFLRTYVPRDGVGTRYAKAEEGLRG